LRRGTKIIRSENGGGERVPWKKKKKVKSQVRSIKKGGGKVKFQWARKIGTKIAPKRRV